MPFPATAPLINVTHHVVLPHARTCLTVSDAPSTMGALESDAEVFFKLTEPLGTAGPPVSAALHESNRRKLVDAADALWKSAVRAVVAGAGAGPLAGRNVGGATSRDSAASSVTSWRSAGATAATAASGSSSVPAGSGMGSSSAAGSGGGSNVQGGGGSNVALLGKPLTIEIGRVTLSENEKWKLQAALRREETRGAGKEYNKKLLRATKLTKGPVPGEAFPAGRGKPIV
mgnify:FL=1